MVTIANLKNDLHKLVVETEEQEILLQIKFIFEQMKKQNVTKDWYEELSFLQKKSLDTGLQQLAEGHRTPHSEVREEINKLLGK